MRTDWSELDRFRMAGQPHGGPRGGRYGVFQIRRGRVLLCIIANDGTFHDWEHVSIHARDQGGMRCPTWDEMDYVKRLFWDDEEAVMQLHPPRSDWISNHAHVLHLWRPTKQEIPRPPGILVGIKEAGTIVS